MFDTEIPVGTSQHDQLVVQCRSSSSTDWVQWSGQHTRLSPDPAQRALSIEKRRARIAKMNGDLDGWEYRLAVRTVWETEWVAV